MSRVLVAGGAGSIGSELVRQLVKNHKVYVLDINESGIFDLTDSLKGQDVWGRVGDIRDYKTVKDVFDDFKPEIIYNCAAYKHVPLMEYTPLEAINTNVIGHYNLIHCAKTWECVQKFVYVSTDKAASSHSIMGATKRLGEIITKNQGKGYCVVRFGNVIGSRGSLMSIWQRQADAGEPLTVTDERMERYMMTIPQAVGLIIEAGERCVGGETFILDMGKPVNIYNLALSIIEKTDGNQSPTVTGIREGETLTEKLMTAEEEALAVKEGNLYVIR
jgi:FlaA1/EpsC-like NDP-sugar epimerase